MDGESPEMENDYVPGTPCRCQTPSPSLTSTSGDQIGAYKKWYRKAEHRLPKNPDRRAKWVQAIRRRDWVPSNRSALCSEHFREQDLDRTSVSSVRLRDGVVPSVFPAFPSYLQRDESVKRQPRKRARMDMLDHAQELMEPDEVVLADAPQPGPSSAMQEDTCAVVPDTPRKKLLSLKLKSVMGRLASKNRKLKALRQTRSRLKSKVATLQHVLSELQKKNLINDEYTTFLESVSKGNKDLLMRQIKKTNGLKVPNKYSPELRAFALTLNYYSPKAYSYVRKHFDSCLPHPRTLSRWYETVNCMPGFCKEAKDLLHLTAERNCFPLLCNLVMDEMAVRRFVEFDGKETWGYVRFGGNFAENDQMPVAKEALVFMLVGLNSSWKVPIGYFFIDGLNGERRCSLVKACLEWVHHPNIKVTSMTFDGPCVNFSMANNLGCNLMNYTNLQTSFTHPVTQEPVSIFLDACHMLKLVRNTFGDKKCFFDGMGQKIQWALIESLEKLQRKEGLHVANKLRGAHINYRQQIMKVKLAVQLLSNSVADALTFCQVKKISGFENSQGTIKFIRMFNRLFDILNSRSIFNKGSKRPIDMKNYNEIKSFFHEMDDYIQELKLGDGTLICVSPRKTGFVGLRVCMMSVLAIYEKWVEKERILKYILTYKLSQDHLEIFFGVIRSMFGCNNNPSCRQFASAFKKNLVHKELMENKNGNCVPMDKVPILTCSVVKNINISSVRSIMVEEHGSDDIMEEHNYASVSDVLKVSEFKTDIIRYISGFVVRKIECSINCEDCLGVLRANSEDSLSLLIDIKNKGGLISPSDDVISICTCSEKVLKTFVLAHSMCKVSGKVLNNLTSKVLAKMLPGKLFSTLNEHTNDQSFMENHIVMLIKLIALFYMKLRCHHEARGVNDVIHNSLVRQKLNKLVIFKGQ